MAGQQNPKPTLSYAIDDFVAATGVGRTKIYEEIAAGRLRAVKCGSRTLIPYASAQAWLDNLPALTA